jgi:hypothetical protein
MSAKSAPMGSLPRIGIEPRRIVKSCGASVSARAKCRSAAARSPACCRCQASANSARACCSFALGGFTHDLTCSGGTGRTPSRTHARSAAWWASESIEIRSLNVSVPKATSLGRTMVPASSIHTTVGTLIMA